MSYEDLNFIDKIAGQINDYASNLTPKKMWVLLMLRDMIEDMVKGYEGGHHG